MSQQFGIVAEFKTPHDVLNAVSELKKHGYAKIDVHSPFPIHGIDKALQLGQSKLPLIVFVGGLLGCSGGMLLQWWVSVVEYPLVISGKPLFSLPAFIPVAFELTILLSAICTVFGMFALNQLPRFNHGVFEHSRFRKATDDRFFVSVEATDAQYQVQKTKSLLEQLSAHAVEVIQES